MKKASSHIKEDGLLMQNLEKTPSPRAVLSPRSRLFGWRTRLAEEGEAGEVGEAVFEFFPRSIFSSEGASKP
jgi:hypothetical protein